MENLVSSICNLNTRKFGDVGEILMSKIVKGLEKSDDLSYDKKVLLKVVLYIWPKDLVL